MVSMVARYLTLNHFMHVILCVWPGEQTMTVYSVIS